MFDYGSESHHSEASTSTAGFDPRPSRPSLSSSLPPLSLVCDDCSCLGELPYKVSRACRAPAPINLRVPIYNLFFINKRVLRLSHIKNPLAFASLLPRGCSYTLRTSLLCCTYISYNRADEARSKQAALTYSKKQCCGSLLALC